MIGIIPLFIPNTGMKIKLCSLKYTPYTVAAVEENISRILFIPNVVIDPIDCMMIDGTPTR